MPSHERRYAPDDRAEDAIAEALDLLEELDEWLLPQARWIDVGDLIVTLSTAVEGGDIAGIRNATGGLRQISPVRVKRLGEEPTEPPPPPVRDRLNILVHRLQSEPGAAPVGEGRNRDD
ncbi:CATRA system-associated protein [Amycolatopsis sp. NPDC051371]|uniref:CATRA system-associated protein n=1 Tax=Amycolatopsis sp. NPDC051371 TaxID=3155800 RepID=UPI0034338D1E